MLKYLARYTHRVAISNRRLVALEDGEVRFRWKDYAHGGGEKTMTLRPSSSSAGSSCTCCPGGSCGSATTASWPTAFVTRRLRCVGRC